MKFQLLFEQSGSFKNALKDLGHEAVSYDISNLFNETDHVIDLFKEIDKYFSSKKNIFSSFASTDVTIAFFPCIYFSGQNELIWSRKFKAFRQWDEAKIDNYIHKRKEVRATFYSYLNKLITIYKELELSLIIENPYSRNWLLSQGLQPQLVIQDRRIYGDNRKKPTMFYYYNIEVQNNNVPKTVTEKETLLHNKTGKGIKRSLIHPEFVYNFLKTHVLPIEEVQGKWTQQLRFDL